MQDNQPINVSSIRRNRAIVKGPPDRASAVDCSVASSRQQQGNPIGGCLERGVLT